MTMQQTGLPAFKEAPGTISIDSKHRKKAPEQILRARAKDDSQGLLGFLKTVDKQFTVTHDENDDKAKYKLNEGHHLSWGPAIDRSRDWIALNPRPMRVPT